MNEADDLDLIANMLAFPCSHAEQRACSQKLREVAKRVRQNERGADVVPFPARPGVRVNGGAA